MIYSISFLNSSAEGYHIAGFHLFARLNVYPTTLLVVIGNECAPLVVSSKAYLVLRLLLGFIYGMYIGIVRNNEIGKAKGFVFVACFFFVIYFPMVQFKAFVKRNFKGHFGTGENFVSGLNIDLFISAESFVFKIICFHLTAF